MSTDPREKPHAPFSPSSGMFVSSCKTKVLGCRAGLNRITCPRASDIQPVEVGEAIEVSVEVALWPCS